LTGDWGMASHGADAEAAEDAVVAARAGTRASEPGAGEDFFIADDEVGFCFVARGADASAVEGARGTDASDVEGARGADAADVEVDRGAGATGGEGGPVGWVRGAGATGGEGGPVGWVSRFEVCNAMILSGGSFRFDCFFFLAFAAARLPFFHGPCFGSVAFSGGGGGSFDSVGERSFAISAAVALSYAIQPLGRRCLCGRRVAASTLTFLGMMRN
jgi:hypothetical protein